MTQCTASPAPPTTVRRSSRHQGVPTPFTRTTRVAAVQSASRRAATTSCRVASFLSSGATASSRSRKTSSAASPAAFASIFSLDPGTARQERRMRAALLSVAVTGAKIPESVPAAVSAHGSAARARHELGGEDDLTRNARPAAVRGLEVGEQELCSGDAHGADIAAHDGDRGIVYLGDDDVVAADERDIPADADLRIAEREER